MSNNSERGTPDRMDDLDLSVYVERKLQGSIFSGSYTDRCFVHAIQSYKDRIQVDSEEETVLRHLKSVLRKLKKSAITKPGKEYFGIEKCSDTFNIYLDWRNAGHPFGHYWFSVDKVEVLKPQNIVFIHLKILRPITSRDITSGHPCPHCGKLPQVVPDGDPLDFSDLARKMQVRFREMINPTEWWHEASPHLTLSNVVKFFKFSFLIMAAFVSGGAELIVKVLSLTHKTIHELGFFIRQATPFLMGCLDMMSRCIAGFYTLIAMMWRDSRRPAGPQPTGPNPAPAIGYKRDQQYPYLRQNVQRPYTSRNNYQTSD